MIGVVQSPPKRIVFRFHYHSQKVIGVLWTIFRNCYSSLDTLYRSCYCHYIGDWHLIFLFKHQPLQWGTFTPERSFHNTQIVVTKNTRFLPPKPKFSPNPKSPKKGTNNNVTKTGLNTICHPPPTLKAGNNSNGSGRLFFEANIGVAEEVQRVHDLDFAADFRSKWNHLWNVMLKQ